RFVVEQLQRFPHRPLPVSAGRLGHLFRRAISTAMLAPSQSAGFALVQSVRKLTAKLANRFPVTHLSLPSSPACTRDGCLGPHYPRKEKTHRKCQERPPLRLFCD